MTKLISTNPSTYELLGEVAISTEAEISEIVSSAKKAQRNWWKADLDIRVSAVRSLISLFEKYADEFATKTSDEMGMPKPMSYAIVGAAIADLTWICDHAKEALSNKITHQDDQEINEIIYEPYGVLGLIVAWNFPLDNFAKSAGQALVAGNAIVMKYSEEVPLFCKFLEEVVAESDMPEGVINFIYGDGKVGQMLTETSVDFMSFTGSFDTGHKLYQKAAEKFIPMTLELGGSSPGIVFEDANLDDETVEEIFWKRFANTGQFCDGLKRLIVHASRHDELMEKLSKVVSGIKLGTDLGPLVNEKQLLKFEAQLKDSLDKGAKIITGGKRPEGLNGAFHEPTILSNITKDMRFWKEEVFGPGLAVVIFETYDEAIELANDTRYGLSAYVYTQDKDLFQKAQRDIVAGAVSTKGTNIYRTQNPFGGFKCSGIGRQVGMAGFHEVVQTKVISYPCT